MLKLSLIIPLYNEEKNIKPLFNQVSKLQKKINLEFIAVNNGSKDNSTKEMRLFKKKINNLKIINIKKNIGFGNGIKVGISKAKCDLICYTHGDLQYDLFNILKAYKIYKLNKTKKILIKGRRSNRPLFDIFFTFFMSTINTILFRKLLVDIHAQPNLFNKSLIKNINLLPNNMIFDLYILLSAKIKNYKITRFKVNFLNRQHGVGSNDSLVKKLKYSLLSLFSSLNIFFNGRF